MTDHEISLDYEITDWPEDEKVYKSLVRPESDLSIINVSTPLLAFGRAVLPRQKTPDVEMAVQLHNAGLECVYGQVLYYREPDTDPLKAFTHLHEMRTVVGRYALGENPVPVYIGPSAILSEKRLSVHNSQDQSTSVGIWVPRINPRTFKPEKVRNKSIQHRLVRAGQNKDTRKISVWLAYPMNKLLSQTLLQ